MSESAQVSFDTIGMTEDEMEAYIEELLLAQAQEAAVAEGHSLEKELDGMVYAAIRSTSSFTIKLIAANNAFLARHLLDLGVLQPGSGIPAGDTIEG